MDFNFQAILKAVERTVARVFGKRIIFLNHDSRRRIRSEHA